MSLSFSHFKDGQAFLSASHRDFILELSEASAEKLLLEKSEIYDHAFPFNFKTSLAAGVRMFSRERSFLVQKADKGWERVSTDGDKSADLADDVDAKKQEGGASKGSGGKSLSASKKPQLVDTEKLEDFLDRIKSFKGTKYKKAPHGGVASPLRSIKISGDGGGELFSLEEISSRGGKSWVKTNLWGEMIQLDSKELDGVFSLDIFADSKPEK